MLHVLVLMWEIREKIISQKYSIPLFILETWDLRLIGPCISGSMVRNPPREGIELPFPPAWCLLSRRGTLVLQTLVSKRSCQVNIIFVLYRNCSRYHLDLKRKTTSIQSANSNQKSTKTAPAPTFSNLHSDGSQGQQSFDTISAIGLNKRPVVIQSKSKKDTPASFQSPKLQSSKRPLAAPVLESSQGPSKNMTVRKSQLRNQSQGHPKDPTQNQARVLLRTLHMTKPESSQGLVTGPSMSHPRVSIKDHVGV